MALISTRIPDELEKELEWYANKENIGKTIALRKALNKGLKEIKLEHALEQYKKGKITLMKAAEMSDMPLWEILDIVRDRRIPLYYTLKDAEEDIKAAAED